MSCYFPNDCKMDWILPRLARRLPSRPATKQEAARLALTLCLVGFLLFHRGHPTEANNAASLFHRSYRLTLHSATRSGLRKVTDLSHDQRNVTGLQRLGRPFVINLEHRADRMGAFTRRMDAVGITNITVIRGVPHKCGQLGLTLAHITALQQCWASHWVESCLIMEDDFALRIPQAQAASLVDRFVEDVHDWDVLMLSCNLQDFMHHDGRGHLCPPYALRVVRGLSAAGYAVKRAYAPTITDTLLDAVGRLKNECGIYFTNDVARIKLQGKDIWYTFPDDSYTRGTIGYQVASFSDVRHDYTDYGMK